MFEDIKRAHEAEKRRSERYHQKEAVRTKRYESKASQLMRGHYVPVLRAFCEETGWNMTDPTTDHSLEGPTILVLVHEPGAFTSERCGIEVTIEMRDGSSNLFDFLLGRDNIWTALTLQGTRYRNSVSPYWENWKGVSSRKLLRFLRRVFPHS